jgi:hypothetical protein
MIRKLLVIAVLSATVGFAVSAANAAPPSMLETLKVSVSEGNMVQEARYRHRRGYRNVRRQNCWWGDRWLCRYFW